MNPHPARLAALRAAMKTAQLDAWIVPTADPHLSEYLPEHWQNRVWLSGFTGSAGTLVLTHDAAALWVDSRYFVQAAHQLEGSGIEMGKLGEGSTHTDWLLAHLPEGSRVGAAADMLSLASQKQWQQALSAKNITLEACADLAGQIRTDRPALPQAPIYAHHADFVVESCTSKLARVRAFMAEKGADYHLISGLDDIAWLTNLRGSDVAYNPVFLAHMLIGRDDAVLFVDTRKLMPSETAALEAAGIQTAPYETAADALANISGSLLLDPAKTAASTVAQLPPSVCVVEHINPTTLFKAIKTPQEAEHIRTAMREDGIALCGFFAEFERKLSEGARLTELDIADMLTAHRSQRPHYVSPSFGTIAGFNANGALPHYSATPEAHSEISGNGLLLIDSGAQYHSGTTDITRVVPVGTPSAAQCRDYTLVLKAHIALAQAVFPENLPTPMIDMIARQPMWQAQCDYGHGTGHGVGFFMNVHEGPQVLAYRAAFTPHNIMREGMFTSNEPGLYREGQWGIRIENLILTVPVDAPQETEFGRFLRFDTLTLCPIDTRLIDTALLTEAERAWLNRYHAEVRATLAPHLEGEALAWLNLRTEAV